ncbi:MAG: 3-deoxy-7-phosphoheptulonate synthase [Eubacteriales bacterium]|nr:3-deoxy-7-phosphoheptulonate synthase [Eubacteriales bacterium]MDD4475270.1 3-deoxy-7-phosphoheptulonate synthase [Eubacteriales bacterium]
MVVLLKKNIDEKQLNRLINWLEDFNIEIHMSQGMNTTIMGLIGDTSVVDIDLLKALDIVEDVKRIQEPYKNANRKFHPANTVVNIGGVKVGGGDFALIAGPCSVESLDQMKQIAKDVKSGGANMLRGGAFKPRTSPYAFQGMREQGIEVMMEARAVSGLPIVSEVMDPSQLKFFEDVDLIQVGARNMQNFELLKELGKLRKPVLLKRGLANTLQEWLMSAEYIMAGGNEQVILCERGIRTFETATRNTLDISAVPMLKSLTHLPIIVDPSHGVGIAKMVPPLALAATAAGADGLIIEVHNDPPHAMSDGAQSLTPEAFAELVTAIRNILPFAYKSNE